MARINYIADSSPSLLEEWNWEKNKDISNPYEIKLTSPLKVWWKCKKCGYEWQASISSRHSGRGCPYCAKNVVWSGHNDLATLYPELLKDWDYDKNDELDPKMISVTSTKKAWWKCQTCGYEWYATVGSRARGGNGCPVCSGKAVLEGHNDLMTTNPELAAEWNYEKNGNLSPSMVTAGSQKKVWWKCQTCGYEWQASINGRKRGTGCPMCGRKRMAESHRKTSLKKGINSLANVNPELAKEWDYDKNELSPKEVTANTHRKAWWICPDCGYRYKASIANRHKNGSGCPVCANQILCTGINDLETLYPDIALEWSDKNKITPDKVLAGGHTKYFFKCKHCGYLWKAEIVSRINGRGCPNCSFSLHTSIPEQVIYQCLKHSLPETLNSYKPTWFDGKEIDIYIPKLKIGIEYDGGGWHQNVNKDIAKTELLKKHGIALIRIREPKCPKIDDKSIQIVTDEPKSDLQYLNKAIQLLYSILNNQFNANIVLDSNINKIYTEELIKYRNKELNVSFAAVYPDLMTEWNKPKNEGIDPNKIPPKSGVLVWWKCKKCGYEWKAPISRRAAGAGCPYCANEITWAGHNDVETLRPDLLEEWDFDSNNISPQEVSPSSHKKVAWICSKCGHKWKSPLYSKAAGHGCPVCARTAVSKRCSKRVKNLDTGEIFDSAMLAAEKTGIGHSNITRVCRGEGKMSGGFHWAYIDEDENQ